MSVTVLWTRDGLEVPAVTAEQMREVDRLAIEEVGPNLFQMMENAGRNLALTVLDRLGHEPPGPIVVLAGTGGNGGGGICAGRHLANHGVNVVLVLSNGDGLGPVPAAQLRIFHGTNGRQVGPDQVRSLEAAIVVDALVGYSLSGPPRGVVAELIAWANDQEAPVVSLDVPSGVDSTSGHSPGVAVSADLTLTLALPKTGMDAPEVGELWLGDIGIPAGVYRRVDLAVPAGLFAGGYRVPLQVR